MHNIFREEAMEAKMFNFGTNLGAANQQKKFDHIHLERNVFRETEFMSLLDKW